MFEVNHRLRFIDAVCQPGLVLHLVFQDHILELREQLSAMQEAPLRLL